MEMKLELEARTVAEITKAVSNTDGKSPTKPRSSKTRRRSSPVQARRE